MFIPAYVLQWRGGRVKRVRDEVNGDHYALNTNRMYEITLNHDGDPTMYFFDNPADSRDGGLRMVITDETIDSIKTYADMDHGSESITLDVFTDNDPTQATYELTLAKSTIAYVYDYPTAGLGYTWVVYADMGWNVLRILVSAQYDTLWHELNGDIV